MGGGCNGSGWMVRGAGEVCELDKDGFELLAQ